MKFQTKEPEKKHTTATEKDKKTRLNLGTKFQCDAILEHENSKRKNADFGANLVKVLASKFDSIENKSNESNKVNLKQIMKEQSKLISNLKEQITSKDKRIQELEENIKHILCPNLEIALSMTESSA